MSATYAAPDGMTDPHWSRGETPPAMAAAGDATPAFTADEIARVTGGRLLAQSKRPIRGAAVDSREVQPDEMFIALPGERVDGHGFLGAAVAAGASALLVTRPPLDPTALGDVTVIRVANGEAALAAVATAWRRRFDPLVVGITGSIAKTSTKEAVAAVLGRGLRTLKSVGNQNNEIGLPLTVLRLGPEHQAMVLEMGMYVGGEIADLARIARPDIGVVTAVQAVHLSRIGTIDAVEQAKGELLEALPRDGTAILNADDPIVRRMGSRTVARTLTYGFADDADVRAEAVSSAGIDGMRFAMVTPGQRRPAVVPTLGRLSVHNALAAAAVGVAAGLSSDVIAAGLADGWSAPHRVTVHRLRGVTVVDDTYNASPGSMRAALEILEDLPGRRVAVLGEMLELGIAHDDGHHEVGQVAGRVAELLIVVGRGAGAMADGARETAGAGTRILSVSDGSEAFEALLPRLRDGDVVLVKASRGIGLDRLVDAIRDERGPERTT